MNPLRQFLLSVVLWLPVCFGVWYFLSILFTPPLASMLDTLMTWVFPDIIERIVEDGNELVVNTRLVASGGDVFLEINALKFGYCVPLYTCLVLATPGEDMTKVMRWLVGMLILLGVQIFGVATEILKVLAFQVNEEARELLGLPVWSFELVGLAAQLGFLILPSVAPIMIWFGQFQDTLSTVIGVAETQK